MTLRVFSARMGRWMKNDPDAIDITRKSAKPEWLFLAPSWGILGPALEARKQAAAVRAAYHAEVAKHGGLTNANGYPTMDEFAFQKDEEALVESSWRVYEPAFLAEMRVSHGMPRNHPAWGELENAAHEYGVRSSSHMWDVLLSRQRVVLCCYCSDAEHCHRTILRRDILPKLGAEDCGEMKLREAA